MNSPSSEPVGQIDARFAAVLEGPLPDPATMDSAARIAQLNLYKEMMKAIDLPKHPRGQEIIKHGISLITVDRAAAAKEARANSAAAKKTSTASTKVPSLDDL